MDSMIKQHLLVSIVYAIFVERLTKMQTDKEAALKLNLKRLAFEASIVSDMTNAFKNIFPNILDTLKESFTKVDTMPDVKLELSSHQRQVMDNLQKLNFLDISELAITVPEGFEGNLASYAEAMLVVANNLSGIMQTTLVPYTNYLAQYISNKEVKLSTKDMTSQFASMYNLRKENVDSLNAYIGETKSSRVKIGKVLSRKPEIEQVFRTNNTINKVVNSLNLADIKKQVKRCTDLIDLIVDQVNEGKITNMSPEAAKNLAFGATEIASEVEFLSIFYFRAKALSNTVDSMTNTLHNVMTNNH